jgi:transposase
VVFKLEDRIEADYMAHARRRFDELLKAGASAIAAPALQRIAALYRTEQEVAMGTTGGRLETRVAQPAALERPACLDDC